MAKSIDKAKLISDARRDRYKNKGLRPDKLNDKQFNAVLFKFYQAAKARGLFTSVEEAVENKGYYFLGPQRDIAECILASVFKREKRFIYVSIPRQVGKTDIIVFTISFCYDHYSEIFGDPLRIATIAPEKGTATEVFDRLHDYIILNETELATDTKARVETLRGDTIALYGLYEGGGAGATIEGRTHDIIIRDEAHMGDDHKFMDQVIPTTSRTRGPIILIGNGGFRDCFFRNGILGGTNKEENRYVFRYTFDTLEAYMLDLWEKGVTSAGTWLDNTRAYIAACGGRNSISVRKNVFCEWILEIGSFVTNEDMDRCANTSLSELTNDLYVAIDVAVKGRDRTIVTIGDSKGQTFDYVILKDVGENVAMREQCEILADYCEDMGYLQRIRAIGVDATGLGQGMAEFLDMTFEIPIKPFNFSQQSKQEWYLNLRDAIITVVPGDRLSFNEDHELYESLRKELVDIEVEITRNGNLSFHAPTSAVMGKAVNDDFVASLAIYRSIVGMGEGFYDRVRSLDERLPKDLENYIAEQPTYVRSAFRNGPWGGDVKEAASPKIAALRQRRAEKKASKGNSRLWPF